MLPVTKHVVWRVYVLRLHIYMIRFYFFTFYFYIIQRYTSHRTMWRCEEVGRYARLVLPRSSEHWPWCDVTKAEYGTRDDVTKAEYGTRDDVTFYTVYPSHKTYPCQREEEEGREEDLTKSPVSSNINCVCIDSRNSANVVSYKVICENSTSTLSHLRQFCYQAPVWNTIILINPADEFWNFLCEEGFVKEYSAPHF
jgi:hypothetical protein